MAIPLSEIQEHIDALERALATGQLQITYRDKTVRYRDVDEMDRILARLQRKCDQLQGTRARSRQIRMVTSDGYGR